MTSGNTRYSTVLGPGPWCGTTNGYFYHKCRCELCRSAKRKHGIKYKTHLNLKEIYAPGTHIQHKRFGHGIIQTKITGDGYITIRFDRTRKLGKTKSVKELHYSRLEVIGAENSSN